MKENRSSSLSGKQWRLRAKVTNQHQQLAHECGLEPMFATILADRGLNNPMEVERYLRPRLQDLADPHGLLDMKKAVDRLLQAIETGESIAVFGDYDVDGATSSALLLRYFRALGVVVRVYIPDRISEGYGPNAAAMLLLAEEGIKVVITVDCGVTAFSALEAAQQAGMDVIVTDHHQVSQTLPTAYAIINPNRLDETFPHQELAGVGVAFYLLMALNRALRQKQWFSSARPEPKLKTWLDLVAVGTVADVASLTGLNRILVASGLLVAGESHNLGLQALKTSARLGDSIRAGQVAFQLGPRINAGGRLSQGILGVELLSTEDVEKASSIAEKLEVFNKERQGLEEQMLRGAMAAIEKAGGTTDRFGLVVADENWHPGVIGIVASRIAEKKYRPAIVIALDEKGNGKGSGRSIPGINLLAAIEASASHLISFGGHHAAAGLSLEAKNIPAFTEAFNEAIGKQFVPGIFHPTVRVDGEVAMADINRELVARLERLQPFGQGNPEPVIVLRQVRIVDVRVLKDRHIKCQLVDIHNHALSAIAFQVLPGPLGEGLQSSMARLDIAGTLSINRFRDRETVQMIIKDAQLAENRELS